MQAEQTKPAKKQNSSINGILIMDKPMDFTSFDVVAKLRGICQTKKIGHGGTLDPMATGVLPVFIGGTVKAVDMQPRQDKTYEAVILLGRATDTGDVTGETLKTAKVNVSEAQVQKILPRFLGDIEQLPPMYSAVKIDGKALYRYAREGKIVERKPRPITIHSIEYLGAGEEEHQYRIRVHCSKGTYIRVLVEDIGKALGVPATLAALRRTQAGIFTLGNSYTFEQVQQAKDQDKLQELLLPVQTVFSEMQKLQIKQQGLDRLLHGAVVYNVKQPMGEYALYTEDEKFWGLGKVEEENILKATKLFR